MRLSKILTLALLFMHILLTPQASAQERPPNFYGNFSNGLRDWEVSGEEVKAIKDNVYGNCVQISRTTRTDSTYITKKFKARPGTLRFSAMIQSKDIVGAGNQHWERGKFQGILYTSDRKKSYPADDDFEGTFGWKERKFKIVDLVGTETVELRIGLQNAKGTIWVAEIKVFYEPE